MRTYKAGSKVTFIQRENEEKMPKSWTHFRLGNPSRLAQHFDPLVGEIENGHHTIRDTCEFSDSEFDPVSVVRVEGV